MMACKQAARAQTLTKRKAIGVKGVVSKVKDRGLNQYVVLLTEGLCQLVKSATEYASCYQVTSGIH